MDMIKVALVNASTVSDNDAARLKDVLQTQVDRDFTPAWGIAATLSFVPRGGNAPPDRWWLTIFDDSSTGDPGYHELTAAGLPSGYVFAGTARDLGYEWTGVASHELLEMLVDPNCHRVAYAPQTCNSYLYAYEICDPCEAEEFSYEITDAVGPIVVSDFVFPAWFDPLSPIARRGFDYGEYLHGPFQVLPGCHMDVLDVCRGGWRTFWGEGHSARQGRLHLLEHRQALRRKPRHLWTKSEPPTEPPRYRGPRRVLASELHELSLSLQHLDERLRRFRTDW
jgi:hypothetical protein